MTVWEFIKYWKSIDFSAYNEMDVREDFIAPLLNILGYSKNTVNTIIREKSLHLSEPYQRLGRKRVDIDYIPTIRLKAFWILEAKPGSVREMDKGDLLQAYLYATHPEIQAQYIVLCNGWEIQIFDVHRTTTDWEEPFFCISQDNCQENFTELEEILSVKTMLSYRRKKILQEIRNTFEVELDLEQLQSFKREFMGMQYPLEKKIKENVRNLQSEDFHRKQQEENEKIRSADIRGLLGWMDLSGPRNAKLYMEYYHRIETASLAERARLLRKLEQYYWGRPLAEFKCDCLAIYLKVVENQLEVEKVPFGHSPKETLCDIIKGNLTYHRGSPLLNSLAFLDRTCHKFAYLAMKTTLIDSLAKRIEDKKTHMAIEELILKRPTVSGEMVRLINIFVDFLWHYLSREDSVQKIWVSVRVLQKMIDVYGKLEVSKYPNNDSDLLWYDSYGDTFDYLFRVSHLFLRERIVLLETLALEADVMEIVRMEYEEARMFTPKILNIEEQCQLEDIKIVCGHVMMALRETFEVWEKLEKDD